MPTANHSIVALALCLLLTGCGTDVMALLDEDGRVFWQADPIIAAAEDLDRGLEAPIIDAESAKQVACEPVYAKTKQQIYEGDWSYWEKFWSNLALLVVEVFPVQLVERCAQAHEDYNRELGALRQRLEAEGVYPRSRD